MKNVFLIFCQLLIAAALSAQGNNTRLFSLSIPAYDYVDTPIMIGYTVRDNMGDTIHSISISYSVNGGPAVRATIPTWVTGANSGQPVSLTHPVPLVIHAAGDYVIQGSVDSLDHIATATPWSDSVTSYTHFYAASALLHHRVVFEEFTGAWCGHCSGGAYVLDEILNTDTDYIMVAAHIGTTAENDSMQTREAIDMHDTWAGFPGVTINRMDFEADGRTYAPNALYMIPQLEGLAAKSKKAPSPANISMTNMIYDTATRVLSVDVNAEFLATISQGDFRVNLTLTEDSVVHSDTTLYDQGWNQNNYYFSHLSPVVDDTIPALFHLDQTLLDDGQTGGWVHRHVLRRMLGGPWGDTAVIPAHPTAGAIYTKHYSFTMPALWNDRQVSLIAMVQEFHPINNYHQPASWSNPDLILNAVQQPLFDKKKDIDTVQAPSGITTVVASQVRAYPNPSSGIFTIQTSGTALTVLRLYDISGRAVLEQSMPAGSNIIHPDLPSGIYQLSFIGSGMAQNLKIAVIR